MYICIKCTFYKNLHISLILLRLMHTFTWLERPLIVIWNWGWGWMEVGAWQRKAVKCCVLLLRPPQAGGRRQHFFHHRCILIIVKGLDRLEGTLAFALTTFSPYRWALDIKRWQKLGERGSSIHRKGRVFPNIRYLVAKLSIVAINALWEASVELSFCFRRAFSESQHAFGELSTKLIMLLESFHKVFRELLTKVILLSESF